MEKINIAIDGPAASGKTAAANLLAKKINYYFFDTGIIYRAFTMFCLQNNVDLNDVALVIKTLCSFDIKWVHNTLCFNNKAYEQNIYSELVTKNVPKIAKIAEVRTYFNDNIKLIVQDKGFIVVGRDITSVVLLDAEMKIFLTSSLKVRSMRRWEQIRKQNNNIKWETVYQQMQERDKADKNRKIGQLKVVNDAIIIDNSEYDLETTVAKLLIIYQELLHKKEKKYE